MDSSLPGSSAHGILRQKYWSGFPFPSPVLILFLTKFHLLSTSQDLATEQPPSLIADQNLQSSEKIPGLFNFLISSLLFSVIHFQQK